MVQFFCDTCDFFLANSATNFWKIVKTVRKVINEDIAYNSTEEAKKNVRAIIMKNGTYLSKEETDLKAKVVTIK